MRGSTASSTEAGSQSLVLPSCASRLGRRGPCGSASAPLHEAPLLDYVLNAYVLTTRTRLNKVIDWNSRHGCDGSKKRWRSLVPLRDVYQSELQNTHDSTVLYSVARGRFSLWSPAPGSGLLPGRPRLAGPFDMRDSLFTPSQKVCSSEEFLDGGHASSRDMATRFRSSAIAAVLAPYAAALARIAAGLARRRLRRAMARG